MKKLNIIGHKFSRLTVISECENRTLQGKVQFNCLCECGNIIKTVGSKLKSGHTKSCSCLQKEKVKMNKELNKTHGLSKTVMYYTYMTMISRCYNVKNKAYKNYGQRGIKVCDRWLNSFEFFLEDMGEKPTKQHSIDRINVNGDYEPCNCKWSTRIEQENNKRTNVYINYKGKNYTIAELSRVLNINYHTLRHRTVLKNTFIYG